MMGKATTGYTFGPGNNRPLTASTKTSDSTYSYDADGSRIGEGTASYDEVGHLIGEYGTKGKPREETVYLAAMPIAVLKPTVVYFVHSDYRNAPRQIDNSPKAAVWSWDPRGFEDSNPHQNLLGTTFVYKLRFPGQYFDGETLKNYNYLRTYDFETGRYLESDPIGLGGGLNTYAYAGECCFQVVD
jgi:RHS repeat-associated protein